MPDLENTATCSLSAGLLILCKKESVFFMRKALSDLMRLLPQNIDGAIISYDLNRRYFTGMKSSAGTLLVTRREAQVIVDFRYIEKARETVRDINVILQSDDIYGQILQFFKKQSAKTIGIEAENLTIADFKRYQEWLSELQIWDGNELGRLIDRLRSVKTEEEVSLIEQAQAITDQTFSHILGVIRLGITEREIAIEMEYTMHKLGADGTAFDTIVVSGENSSLPHGVPSDKKIQPGDFITMDFGASFLGYCSDMTRTVAVGKISEEQKRVYDTVLTAQKMAIESISESKIYSDVDKVARDYIDQQGYAGCFGHGLGHSLGLFIHEEPRFSPSCREAIGENIIMKVEPGVYLPGKFGVRIEDMVLIGKDFVRDLTKSEKKLITL